MSDSINNQPCPYCELSGFAWDLSLHVPDAHYVNNKSGNYSLQCPFCKEKVISGKESSVIFENEWRQHYSKCTAYAAAMLSGVKL